MRSTRVSSFKPAVVLLLAGAAAAPAVFAADMATVVSSTPVVVSVAQPRQVCTESQQIVQQRPSGAGAVIGAIAGGVLGNSVGGGFGRAAATGLGVVAGSVVGNQVEANNTPLAAVPVQHCQTVTRYEPRTVGYDVVYEYAGQRYSTRMATDPGRQFAVSVQPAAGGSMAVPADLRAGTPVPRADAGAVPVQPVAVAPAAPAYYYDPLPAQTVVVPAPYPVYGASYYGPSYYGPSYYGPSYYAAPVIGFGLGLGLGYYGGHHGGYRGGYGHHGR